MLEWWGTANNGYERGTRLCAQDEQTLIPPYGLFKPIIIPSFYSSIIPLTF
jgi:hypothetical protein